MKFVVLCALVGLAFIGSVHADTGCFDAGEEVDAYYGDYCSKEELIEGLTDNNLPEAFVTQALQQGLISVQDLNTANQAKYMVSISQAGLLDEIDMADVLNDRNLEQAFKKELFTVDSEDTFFAYQDYLNAKYGISFSDIDFDTTLSLAQLVERGALSQEDADSLAAAGINEVAILVAKNEEIAQIATNDCNNCKVSFRDAEGKLQFCTPTCPGSTTNDGTPDGTFQTGTQNGDMVYDSAQGQQSRPGVDSVTGASGFFGYVWPDLSELYTRNLLQGSFFSNGDYNINSVSYLLDANLVFNNAENVIRTGDIVVADSIESGSVEIENDGIEFTASFEGVKDAIFFEDGYAFGSADMVTIETGIVGKSYIITGAGNITFGEDNLTIDHADSIIVGDQIIASNADGIVIPFTFEYDIFDLTYTFDEYNDIQVERSDHIQISERSFAHIGKTQFIVTGDDSRIVLANITNAGPEIEYLFDNPIQPEVDVRVTADTDEQFTYINAEDITGKQQLFLTSSDPIESVIGAQDGRETTFDMFGRIPLDTTDRTDDLITLKAFENQVVIYNAGKVMDVTDELYAEKNATHTYLKYDGKIVEIPQADADKLLVTSSALKITAEGNTLNIVDEESYIPAHIIDVFSDASASIPDILRTIPPEEYLDIDKAHIDIEPDRITITKDAKQKTFYINTGKTESYSAAILIQDGDTIYHTDEITSLANLPAGATIVLFEEPRADPTVLEHFGDIQVREEPPLFTQEMLNESDDKAQITILTDGFSITKGGKTATFTGAKLSGSTPRTIEGQILINVDGDILTTDQAFELGKDIVVELEDAYVLVAEDMEDALTPTILKTNIEGPEVDLFDGTLTITYLGETAQFELPGYDEDYPPNTMLLETPSGLLELIDAWDMAKGRTMPIDILLRMDDLKIDVEPGKLTITKDGRTATLVSSSYLGTDSYTFTNDFMDAWSTGEGRTLRLTDDVFTYTDDIEIRFDIDKGEIILTKDGSSAIFTSTSMEDAETLILDTPYGILDVYDAWELGKGKSIQLPEGTVSMVDADIELEPGKLTITIDGETATYISDAFQEDIDAEGNLLLTTQTDTFDAYEAWEAAKGEVVELNYADIAIIEDELSFDPRSYEEAILDMRDGFLTITYNGKEATIKSDSFIDEFTGIGSILIRTDEAIMTTYDLWEYARGSIIDMGEIEYIIYEPSDAIVGVYAEKFITVDDVLGPTQPDLDAKDVILKGYDDVIVTVTPYSFILRKDDRTVAIDHTLDIQQDSITAAIYAISEGGHYLTDEVASLDYIDAAVIYEEIPAYPINFIASYSTYLSAQDLQYLLPLNYFYDVEAAYITLRDDSLIITRNGQDAEYRGFTLENSIPGEVYASVLIVTPNDIVSTGEAWSNAQNSYVMLPEGSYALVFYEPSDYLKANVYAEYGYKIDDAHLNSFDKTEITLHDDGFEAYGKRFYVEPKRIPIHMYNASFLARTQAELLDADTIFDRAFISELEYALLYEPNTYRTDEAVTLSALDEGIGVNVANANITRRDSAAILITETLPINFTVYNGDYTLQSIDKTEKIAALNKTVGNYMPQTGLRCFTLDPQSIYYYLDEFTVEKDFAVQAVGYYDLCLRKEKSEPFQAECPHCGVFDFLDLWADFNGDMRYLRYPFKNFWPQSLQMKLTYAGSPDAEVYFTYDNNLDKTGMELTKLSDAEVLASTKFSWYYYSIYEMQIGSTMHRLISIDADYEADNRFVSYATDYNPELLMDNNKLWQEGDNTITLLPREIASHILQMR